jgi:ATP-dependent Clp protease ATP-binding subunit ClpA
VDTLISADLRAKLSSLGDYLRGNILGQDEALNDIVFLSQRCFCNLGYPGRPIASMLFLGPTGVGKIETALLFTEHLFGSADNLVRLDMSEFHELDSINVLRGQSRLTVCHKRSMKSWLNSIFPVN